MNQRKWDQEETERPRAAHIAYAVFVGMGLLLIALGVIFGDKQPIFFGLLVSGYFGWRWAKFVRRSHAGIIEET